MTRCKRIKKLFLGTAERFGRYVVALPLHNMPPKKRKQDDSDADGDDVKLEPVIDHARSAIEHISHCTMEELRLVFEAARRRQDRLSLLAANRFEPGDTVTVAWWSKDDGHRRSKHESCP